MVKRTFEGFVYERAPDIADNAYRIWRDDGEGPEEHWFLGKGGIQAMISEINDTGGIPKLTKAQIDGKP